MLSFITNFSINIYNMHTCIADLESFLTGVIEKFNLKFYGFNMFFHHFSFRNQDIFKQNTIYFNQELLV